MDDLHRKYSCSASSQDILDDTGLFGGFLLSCSSHLDEKFNTYKIYLSENVVNDSVGCLG